MKKKVFATLMAFTMTVTALVGCGKTAAGTAPADGQAPATSAGETGEKAEEKAEAVELTGIDAIIAEAETMSMEELAAKAIEESNGKTFYGVGNSSRGKSALPVFIEYLQSIDSSYNMEFECHCECSFALKRVRCELLKDLVVLGLLPLKLHVV